MIKVIMPKRIEQRLEIELKKAGRNEIGGILMGEHVGENTFRICDVTIQSYNGTWIRFVRQISGVMRKSLNYFFSKNKFQYRRYNYLGEWHSHPSFSLTPSFQDIQTMWEIVNDETVGANFAVLLIVKIESQSVNGNVTLYVPGNPVLKGEMVKEGDYT
ncbi:Mov34/MPN/PAD-1 family protein [Bacillus paranthracis]|uniref:Mov34/MPN/PAD-1 family protein n=1 Tax=Bacillus cereus group TaxID=86661 RepID=UPI003D22BA45